MGVNYIWQINIIIINKLEILTMNIAFYYTYNW